MGVAVISLSLLGVMAVSQLSQRIVGESVRSVQASFLAEEGVEALKILRDKGWQDNIASLNAGADYYLEFDGTSWKATATGQMIDGFFTRKFVLENVYRDADDDITESGTEDDGSRKATVSVSWQGRNGTTTKNISTYLTDIFSN